MYWEIEIERVYAPAILLELPKQFLTVTKKHIMNCFLFQNVFSFQ